MRQDSQNSDGRRRRGPRRDGRRSSSSDYNTAGNPRTSTKQPPTLWQKIVSFFNSVAGSQPALNGGSRSPYPTRERSGTSSARPAYRKPEAVEVTTPKLYVGNLSFDATESDLYELFNGVGQVQSAEIVAHKYTEKSKGFAFVMMENLEEAKRAVAELHDKDFMGRKLVVSGAKANDMRDAV